MENTEPNSAPGVSSPADIEEVRKREAREIRTLRSIRSKATLAATDPAPPAEDFTPLENLFGMAFSGGGIRSATLNLGVLQGLAKRGLLRQLDYLSTVSGGGYIGSWLVSWIKRTASDNSKTSTQIIEEHLARSTAEDPAKQEFRPIAYLRQFSNYLTPKFSALSADTWTLAAIWGRNTSLNLAILVGIVAAAIALARLLGAWVAGYQPASDLTGNSWILLGIAFFLLVVATTGVGANLRTFVGTHGTSERQPSYTSQGRIQLFIVIPIIVAALIISIWLYLYSASLTKDSFWMNVAKPAVFFSLLFFAVVRTGGFNDCFRGQHEESARIYAALIGLNVLIAVGPGFVTAALIVGLAHVASLFKSGDQLPWIALSFGPPVVMWVFSAGIILQIGLMGNDLYDSSREWLGRLRAWLIIYSLAWLAFFIGSVWGPFWIASVGGWSGWGSLGIAGSWIGTTIAALFAGNSAKTSGVAGGSGRTAQASALEIIARIGPYAFMVGFILTIAFGVHQLTAFHAQDTPAQKAQTTSPVALPPAAAKAPTTSPVALPPAAKAQTTSPAVLPPVCCCTKCAEPAKPLFPALADVQKVYWQRMEEIGSKYVFLNPNSSAFSLSIRDLDIFFIVTLAIAFILSARVNINEFSLHHFYKNRLARCYLGASRLDRRPNKFTGFDSGDELPVDTLCPTAPKARNEHVYTGPFPIINATLNLSTGSNLAWQERKGSSFVFTPLFTGYTPDPGLLADKTQTGGPLAKGYRRTFDYAYSRRRSAEVAPGVKAKEGISLGTAVAISGAAANPNSGYHTSTAVAFLMTVFDVRLGWWLGNPTSDKTYRSSGPALGLLYLFRELFGLSDDSSGYVSLSDGGHFENMGLYELVRRKCRYIIVGDGEQDEGFTFNGLANAIRKCRTDFGVEIDINVRRIKPVANFSEVHCCMGRIHYPNDSDPGYLFYLKSSVTGDEPRDILEYRDRQPAFPHQSTGDQWFDESQFESYRRLGLHMVDTAFENMRVQPNQAIESIFKCLSEQWYPPSELKDGAVLTHHANAYAALMKRLCDDKELAYLDSQIICSTGGSCGPAPDPGKKADEIERKAFFYCLDLIQLMENVWTDLHLFNKADRENPKNLGWMTAFRHWARQPIFQSTWKRADYTFNPLFQQFFKTMANDPPPKKPVASCDLLPP